MVDTVPQDTKRGEAEFIAGLAAAGLAPHLQPSGGQFLALPQGYQIEDLERFLPVPPRIKACVTLTDPESFIAYVERFRTPNTTVFADYDDFTLSALIDYHGPDDPSHVTHRASFTAKRSLAWQVWVGCDGTKFAQAAFARFLEEHRIDIERPDGATILEVARDLEAKKSVEFKSGVRLRDGSNQLSYRATSEQTNGGEKGAIDVPEEFVLKLPIFFGHVSREVAVFLRYRIEDTKLKFFYEIHRRQEVEHEAFDLIVGHAKEKLKDVAFYAGSD